MRELAVFYCPKCGYYAYYQTSRHPQCPRCCHPDVMHMARMYYKEFMDMGCRERDDYLAQEIMKDNPSFLKRINAPHKRFNSREIIAEMNNRDHASGHRKQDLKRHCEMDARHHLGDDP